MSTKAKRYRNIEENSLNNPYIRHSAEIYTNAYSQSQSVSPELSESVEAFVPGWEPNVNLFTPDYILPNEYTALIDPVHICSNNSRPILLLIVVCSSPKNFEARQTIRETWGNTTAFNYPVFHQMHEKLAGKYLDFNYGNYQMYLENDMHERPRDTLKFTIRLVFIVGQTPDHDTQNRLHEESRMHNDLIQERFVDTYNNLTLKTVMMMKWVNRNCLHKGEYLPDHSHSTAQLFFYFKLNLL